MKTSCLIALTIVLSCSVLGFGQKPVPDDSVYKAVVAKVKSGDTSVDFKALRIAFTNTKAYSPYGGDRDGQKAAFAALDNKNYKDAAKSAEKMLEEDYVDMEAHIAASLGYEGLGNTAKADFHKKVYLGLVNSILSSGDGKSAGTAYVVISTNEEYVVLRALRLTFGSQSLQHLDGHTFDVMNAADPKTKKSSNVFFNIDIVWKAENDLFK